MVNRKRLQSLFVIGCVVALNLPLAARAQSVPSVPKWQRFELTLRSSVNYTNPVQQAEVRTLFVSPLGETNRVYGFWDGGRTWRVRFQPGFPGRWTYYTMCSDTANPGLHGQTGEFLCTAARDDSRFGAHGPVQVARGQRHFEHADRTPFLWLGDAAWQAAARSTMADWTEYVQTRAKQKFNVVQWQLPENAWSGRELISVNLEVFRQLEPKVEAANRAGLLNAIAPLWEIGAPSPPILPEDQAMVLLRYCVARWGAEPVAWLIAFEADDTGAQAERWRQIGRAVFDKVSHAPVVVSAGESLWVLDEFRKERWVDALGFQTAHVTGEDSLPWLISGPLSLERAKSPARPLVTVSPPAETAPANGGEGFARRLLWWSLLLNTPAGVSCSAQDVAEWVATPKAALTTQPWHQALSLPGAAAIAPVQEGLAATEFWRLQPVTTAAASEAAKKSPGQHAIVASTDTRDVSVIYLPEGPNVNLVNRTIPPGTIVTWFNPRTGERRPAKAIAGSTTTRFDTPAPGDWLLVLRAHK